MFSKGRYQRLMPKDSSTWWSLVADSASFSISSERLHLASITCSVWGQQLLWSCCLVLCIKSRRKLECVLWKQLTRSLLSKHFSWITNKIPLLFFFVFFSSPKCYLWLLLRAIFLIKVSWETAIVVWKEMIWCHMNKYYTHRAAFYQLSCHLPVSFDALGIYSPPIDLFIK